MSKFIVPLTKFELLDHPNADSLSIAKAGMYQCVVKTEDFKNEEYAVYLPVDSVADPNHPLLNFLKGRKVKPCKLRGIVSEGVLLPYSEVKKYLKDVLKMQDKSIEKVTVEGKDFSSILKVSRWRDPTVRLQTGLSEKQDPKFMKYTDIENIKNYPSVIRFGEPVNITEKLHGTSARYSLIDGKYLIGSRNRQLLNSEENQSVWNQCYIKHNIKEKLDELSKIKKSNHVGIYGEIVGPKVQDIPYGQSEPTFFVYDILVDEFYLPPEECFDIAKKLGLNIVPQLKNGKFEEKDLELRLGQSLLDSHVREGIVIKPLVPRYDYELGRVILKVISEDFLMRKGAKDIRE